MAFVDETLVSGRGGGMAALGTEHRSIGIR
jgi:hypothetical protein